MNLTLRTFVDVNKSQQELTHLLGIVAAVLLCANCRVILYRSTVFHQSPGHLEARGKSGVLEGTARRCKAITRGTKVKIQYKTHFVRLTSKFNL